VNIALFMNIDQGSLDMSVPCLRQALGKARGPAKLVELDRGGGSGGVAACGRSRSGSRARQVDRTSDHQVDRHGGNQQTRTAAFRRGGCAARREASGPSLGRTPAESDDTSHPGMARAGLPSARLRSSGTSTRPLREACGWRSGVAGQLRRVSPCAGRGHAYETLNPRRLRDWLSRCRC
jgi:hypothetical protein